MKIVGYVLPTCYQQIARPGVGACRGGLLTAGPLPPLP